MEWPQGLDYISALELLDAHDAIDFEQVEAWKQREGAGLLPLTAAAAASDTGDVTWSKQALTDLVELHEDGLPVRWPAGLNVTAAKELLSRLSAAPSSCALTGSLG